MFVEHAAEIIAAVMVFLIPIVAILAAHQRKMATILRGDMQNEEVRHLAHEVSRLQFEVAELRDAQRKLALPPKPREPELEGSK